jgi:adenylosuccinate synthase
VNGVDSLALTKLDTLSGYREPARLHRLRDRRPEDRPLPVGITPLDQVKPVYEAMPGWSEPLSGLRTFGDLPTPRATMSTSSRTSCASRDDRVGRPARDQTIFR